VIFVYIYSLNTCSCKLSTFLLLSTISFELKVNKCVVALRTSCKSISSLIGKKTEAQGG
jgi:hypothetical protein